MGSNEIISSGLLELYVLGMLNEQETELVTGMLKQYPEIETEIVAIEQSLEQYARAQAALPSPTAKENIFAQIKSAPASTVITGAHTAAAKVVPIASFWKYAAAASFVLLIGSLIFNLSYYRKYETANNELLAANKEKSAIEQQLLAQQQVSNEMNDKWGLFQSKYSEPVALHGLPAAPDAAAKILWMKNTGEVYIDPSNLPDAPEGKQYQLWGIVDGKPVDGGLIITTKKEDKYRIQKMKSFGKADAFAVTLETTGGNPLPKGDMYVMGKM